MRMYVKVMAAVIACILLSGEALSAFATTPATENLSWFKKKKKKSVFISEGQPPEVNELGIKSEYNNNLFTKIILLVFALLGFTLCVLDIRDDGMLLKLSFGETEFNYAGSLIGVVVMIISMIVMLFHKPGVHLKK